MKQVLYVFVLVFSFVLNTILGQDLVTVYEEKEGIVVIELDSVPDANNDGWEIDSSLAGYAGTGYLIYLGSDYFKTPDQATIKMKVNIQTVGKYRFQWHSRIAKGEDNTEHNDTWLRFNNASDFYGQKIVDGDTSKVYPKDINKEPVPNGDSFDGWFKVYQNVKNAWTWNTSTSDHDPHDIYVEFDTAGEYKLEVSARSNGHAIDRIVLFHATVEKDSALDLSRVPSTSYEVVGVANSLVNNQFFAYPNPAKDRLNIELSSNADDYQISIFDAMGYVKYPVFTSIGTKALSVDVDSLPNGVYFLKCHSTNSTQIVKFIKRK